MGQYDQIETISSLISMTALISTHKISRDKKKGNQKQNTQAQLQNERELHVLLWGLR